MISYFPWQAKLSSQIALVYSNLLILQLPWVTKTEFHLSMSLHEYENDPRCNEHYLSSFENKAWKKFRPVLLLK